MLLFNDRSGFLSISLFCMGNVCDDGTSAFSLPDEGNTCFEFGKHRARGKLVFFHVLPGFGNRQDIQEFFLICAEIQADLFYAGKDEECICTEFLRKQSACQVLSIIALAP